MFKHDQWEWSAYLLFWQKQIVVSVQQCRPVILNESIGNQYPLRIHLKTWDTEALTKEKTLRFLTRGRLSGFLLLQWLMSLSLFCPDHINTSCKNHWTLVGVNHSLEQFFCLGLISVSVLPSFKRQALHPCQGLHKVLGCHQSSVSYPCWHRKFLLICMYIYIWPPSRRSEQWPWRCRGLSQTAVVLLSPTQLNSGVWPGSVWCCQLCIHWETQGLFERC